MPDILLLYTTIANCMKQEWNIGFEKVSDILDKYDLLSYIDTCYEDISP